MKQALHLPRRIEVADTHYGGEVSDVARSPFVHYKGPPGRQLHTLSENEKRGTAPPFSTKQGIRV